MEELLHWFVKTVGIGVVAGAAGALANFYLKLWDSRPRFSAQILSQGPSRTTVLALEVWNRSSDSLFIEEIRIEGKGSPEIGAAFGSSEMIKTRKKAIPAQLGIPPCAPFAHEVPHKQWIWDIYLNGSDEPVTVRVRTRKTGWWWPVTGWSTEAVDLREPYDRPNQADTAM